MRSLARRMLRASLLDSQTYEEVEADRRSLGQATLVVLLAATAIGVASAVQGLRAGVSPAALAFQIVLSVLLPWVVWLLGSAFAYMVGASFLRGPETETDFAEVLRTTGFAFSPGLLRVLACLPPPALGLSIDLTAWLWMMVCGVVAVRQALDFTTLRAVGTFGAASLLLWLVVWGLSVAPLPL